MTRQITFTVIQIQVLVLTALCGESEQQGLNNNPYQHQHHHHHHHNGGPKKPNVIFILADDAVRKIIPSRWCS